MVLYLLKSTACLTLFFLFYKGLLENAQMHRFKRFYLLGGLVLSFIIPAIVFVEYIHVPVTEMVQTYVPLTESKTTISQSPNSISDWDTVNFSLIAWCIYGLGVLLFTIRFVKNLIDIIGRIRRNQKIKATSHTKVLILEKLPPHTFLKYVFLEKEKYQSNLLAPEVLLHEETHAKQRHSYDILFIEFLQLVLWFNPLIYLFKHSIKLNHEFLADDAVLRKLDSPKNYQNTLLSYLSTASQSKYQSITMASAIHYSSIKKRFKVMRKQTSKRAKFIRILLILPLISLLLWSFSETRYIPKISDIPSTLLNDIQQEGIRIVINRGQIAINGSKVALKDFAQTLNTLTKDWEETDYTSYRPSIQVRNTSNARLAEIDKEFKKTHLSKANDGMSIIPPKPPVPPAPPSPDELEEGEELDEEKELEEEEESLENATPVGSESPLASQQPVKSSNSIPDNQYSNQIDSAKDQDPKDEESNSNASGTFFSSPPPLPAPVSPLNHVIEMAQKGAVFYYENQKISSDKAIDLLKNNKNLNIETKGHRSSKPRVRITKSPITISESSKTIGTNNIGVETGTKRVNGKQLFYSRSEGMTHYFNELGESVNAHGELLNQKTQKEPLFLFNGKVIPADEANRLLSNNKSIQVTQGKGENNRPTVLLTDLLTTNSPNPNNIGESDPFIDISDAVAQNASFYFNDNPISVDRAYELSQSNQITRVQVKKRGNKAQKVFFWDEN